MRRTRTQASRGIPVYDPHRPPADKALHPRILDEPLFDEVDHRNLLALQARCGGVWVRALDARYRPVVYVEDRSGGTRFSVVQRDGREAPVPKRNLRVWPVTPSARRRRSRNRRARRRR